MVFDFVSVFVIWRRFGSSRSCSPCGCGKCGCAMGRGPREGLVREARSLHSHAFRRHWRWREWKGAESRATFLVAATTEAWLLERLCRGRGHGRAPERAGRQPDRWARDVGGRREPGRRGRGAKEPRSKVQGDIGLHRGGRYCTRSEGRTRETHRLTNGRGRRQSECSVRACRVGSVR